ncbi:hypothetical protein BGX21_001060 [Mortierella sp. AD011]|nr:hypothetical protein BGX20_009528 [Mortierella sp. AD010]KAF9385461.1 hypothetical protein BGX21_001060 [Mortierella sp. AD011]
MTSRLEQPKIIDKRRTISGTEYLDSITGEWIASSTSRCINPELVELYEWLHNSGYREGETVFASLHRSNVGWAKGAKKRLQAALPGESSAPQSPKDVNVKEEELEADKSFIMVEVSDVGDQSFTMAEVNDIGDQSFTMSEVGDVGNQSFTMADVDNSSDGKAESVQTNGSDTNFLKIKTEPQDYNGEGSSPLSPRTKKPRLETLRVEDLVQLSITQSEQESQSKPSPTMNANPMLKKEPVEKQAQEQEQEVREFNRNTEQMIEVYFKEGMDASGVEMFDKLLGPFRRPTKDFVASFFYAVILSPFTEPATIEAAIHVLDRTLTIHGPEPFQDIWDVQKRRREVADGASAFSRQSTSSMSSLQTTQGPGSRVMSGMSTRSSDNVDSDASTNLYNASGLSNHTGRLPSWNNVWDLIKAEFGLDNRPESKQHIALQERCIRIGLQGNDPNQETPSTKEEYDDDEGESKGVEQVATVTEEQEIRDEIGRAIVGLLIRVLEQDAVLKNVSIRSFFCRDVLVIDPFSPAQSIRQTLDVAFQIISLATSSRYLKSPSNMKSVHTTMGSTGSTRSVVPWPLNERCILNPAGMEILQLGQQFLLLLIRFTEAGQLLPGKGLEELAREVLSRLSKLNKDRKLPGATGSSRSSGGAPFLLERYNLDQTEVFLKTLIQGPCLLDSGTGAGAGVKLRRKEGAQSKGAGEGDYSFSEDDYNGILKSQTGICMGSSAFVMFLVDLWFRSKTGVASGSTNSQLSFQRVVEEYTMPNVVRPSGAPGTTKSTKTKAAAKRSSTEDQDNLGQWNPKDVEQVEWTVMMIEVLVWSWIEARGIRRGEIVGTGLEQALYPDETSWRSSSDESSGWLVMSRLLMKLGGTLRSRWEQLESAIEAAILVEDLCLR